MVWAEIDLDHLRHNLRQIRRALGVSGAGVLAIVKADAYGHGMKAVAKTLAREGVSFLASPISTKRRNCALSVRLPKYLFWEVFMKARSRFMSGEKYGPRSLRKKISGRWKKN